MVKQKRAAVAISGGVDSAVAAKLLIEQGYQVVGLFMRLGEGKSITETAARKVCRELGIIFYPVNLSEKFKDQIIDYFVESYRRGITPNPCVKCNRLIKFGELLRITRDLGVEYLATGHYVRKTKKTIRGKIQSHKYELYRAKDRAKDQSYFLYTLNQDQLKQIIFPLADIPKEQVWKIAAKANLPTLKKESSDICFLDHEGRIKEHNEFLKNYINLISGDILTLDDELKVGEHKGLPLYTIGQRKGIEIGGAGPFYVAKTDYKKNILYVVKDQNDPRLFTKTFLVKDINWISGDGPAMPFSCEAAIRYGHDPVKAEIKPDKQELSSFNKQNPGYTVDLQEPQRAVAPGQSAVFYQKDQLIGGGIIDEKVL